LCATIARPNRGAPFFRGEKNGINSRLAVDDENGVKIRELAVSLWAFKAASCIKAQMAKVGS
jgi:hypothetical protein